MIELVTIPFIQNARYVRGRRSVVNVMKNGPLMEELLIAKDAECFAKRTTVGNERNQLVGVVLASNHTNESVTNAIESSKS